MNIRLVNKIDLEETEQEIQTFKEQNAEVIERNKRKPNKDDLWIKTMLEEEQARHRKLQDEHAREMVRIFFC